MKKTLALALVMMSFALNSCAFKKDEEGISTQDQQVIKNSQKNRAQYSQAEGLYRGTITRPGYKKPVPVDIRILVQTGSVVSSSSGTTIPTYSLSASMVFTNSVKEAFDFEPTFFPENGQLTLSTKSSTTTAAPAAPNGKSEERVAGSGQVKPVDFASMEGSLIGGVLRGDLRGRGGSYGALNAKLIQKENVTAETNPERIERFRRVLGPIEGIYDSTITFLDQRIGIRCQISAGASTSPTLSASCLTDLDQYALMYIDYLADEEPPRVSIESVGTSMIRRIDGYFENGKLMATVTPINGASQNVVMVKTTKSRAQASEDRDRENRNQAPKKPKK